MPMQIGMFVRRLTHFLFFRDNELLGDAGEFGKTCKNEAAVAAARWARGLNYGGGQRGCS